MAAQAGSIQTFRTGVDEATGTPLAVGQEDKNWILTATGAPDGVLPRAAVVVGREQGWYSAPGSSVAIPGTGYISRGASWTGATTTYSYTYNFNLDTTGNHGITMQGTIWADDQVEIRLNNNVIMPMSDVLWNKAPISFQWLNQYFVNGNNSLTFTVLNSGGGPTGLDVSGSIIVSTPEAAEWAMLLGGLGMVGLYWRKDLMSVMPKGSSPA
jgi:hypothetical protein